MVHITFGNMSTATASGAVLGPAQSYGVGLEVNVPSIMANIALGTTMDLVNHDYVNNGAVESGNVLGDIYIKNFNFKIS